MAKRNRRDDLSPEEKVKISREGLKETLALYRYVLPYKWYFVLGMLFLVLSTGTTFGFVTQLKNLLDPAVNQSENWLAQLKQVSIVLFFILIAQALFSFFRVYLFAQVSERAMGDMRRDLYGRLLSLPMRFFDQRRIGELLSRISSDITQLQDALSFSLAEFIRQIATLVIGIVVLLFISIKLSLIMVASFPPMVIAAMLMGRFIRKISRKAQDTLAASNVVVEETLQAIPVVKAFTNESYEAQRYGKSIAEVIETSLLAARARGLFVSVLILAVFGGITLVLWFGANMIGTGEISVGDLVTFIMLTMFIGASVAGLGDMYGQLQKTLGASQRIREILRETPELDAANASPQRIERPAGQIRFSDVHFRYPTRADVEVLKGIDLEIGAGERVALVGHSGAGKSTIAQLILRFYEATEGRIEVDGRDILSYDLGALRAHMAIVPQEVLLFGGTIRENIAYGRPGASDEAIEDAARRANALEFIRSFPEGMNTLVGERGVKLSGGQRQRIAIARAILKDPAILILDEATSSLDAESEQLVQSALNELMKGRSTIVIAHRLSTIRSVDCIYVISEGRIAESGTHEVLLQRRDGVYQNLLQLQLNEN